ncbi:MAG TPA: hypothetical protein VL981_05590 [Candidatus Methylacidiphilales bacterium]|nr:hypothetical protein [Candidatus Methylacidiphilales bacterium]
MNMQTDTSFPQTKQDIQNLKQLTADAAKEIGDTASIHAGKARVQLGELAGHAKEETLDQVNRVGGGLNEVVNSARVYISARPLASMAVAFSLGILFGFSRRNAAS